MASKQQEEVVDDSDSEDGFIKASDLWREIGVSFSSLKVLLNKLEEIGQLTIVKKDGLILLDKTKKYLIQDLFEIKKNSDQKWSEILDDFPFDEYE